MRKFTHQLIKSQADEKKKEEPESGSSSKFFFNWVQIMALLLKL